jgi:hypothetical protein
MRARKISCAFLLISPVFGQFQPGKETASLAFSNPALDWKWPVIGALYSAEQVSERVQTLGDGTRITQTPVTQRQWRDSQGRTRTEDLHAFGSPTSWTVTITKVHDLVAGLLYIIDDQNKVVHRFVLQPPNRLSGGSSTIADLREAANPGTVESLGSRSIEGVMVEGRRTTHVTPVGSVGNDRPLTSISETWYSPELKLTVLSKNSDPRSGESSIRLAKISRAEPDAALFQPPLGYEIVDEQGEVRILFKKP